jgi:hypothetical protein
MQNQMHLKVPSLIQIQVQMMEVILVKNLGVQVKRVVKKVKNLVKIGMTLIAKQKWYVLKSICTNYFQA